MNIETTKPDAFGERVKVNNMQNQKMTPEQKNQRIFNELAFAAGWRSVTRQELPHHKAIKRQILNIKTSEEAYSCGRRFAFINSEAHLLLVPVAAH